MMSLDKSFEIQSGDQDNRKFILKANISVHNVQTCNDGFFLSHKIMQRNGAIAFSKHYSNVLIRISFG